MKSVQNIRNTIVNVRESVRRFPLSTLSSLVFCALSIWLTHNDKYSEPQLERLSIVSGTGILVFLVLHLLEENIRFQRLGRENGLSVQSPSSGEEDSPQERDSENRSPAQQASEKPAGSAGMNSASLRILLWAAGALFLIGWYHYFQPQEDGAIFYGQKGTVLFGVELFLAVASVYAAKIRNRRAYAAYVIDILKSFFRAGIYSVVLYIGLSSIFFTLSKLFGLDIAWKAYMYAAEITFIPLFWAIFLSDYPRTERANEAYEMSKWFRILLVSIVIPLLTIYTIILYAYFTKILLFRVWPVGIVGNLVLWYGIVSTAVLFLSTVLYEKDPLVKKFQSICPIAILPMLAMMFLAMWIRIREFGITKNRWYVLLCGIWVLLSMLYSALRGKVRKKTGEDTELPYRNKEMPAIPVLLSALVLLSAVGPLSGYQVERISQTKRLEDILLRNGMLEDGAVIPNADIAQKDKYEITEILNYLMNEHDSSEISFLPKDYSSFDFETVFGFEQLWYLDEDEWPYEGPEGPAEDPAEDKEESDSVYLYLVEGNGARTEDISDFDKKQYIELYGGENMDETYTGLGEELSARLNDTQLILVFTDFASYEDEDTFEEKISLDELFSEMKKLEDDSAVYSGTSYRPIYFERDTQKVHYRIAMRYFELTKGLESGAYSGFSMEADIYYRIK